MDITYPILIYGGGAMGGALTRAWHDQKLTGIFVVERDPVRRNAFAASAIRAYATIEEVPTQKFIALLAIKPQQFSSLSADTIAQLGQARLLISIMAGVPLSALQNINPNAARVMPNLPVQIGRGMSVACAPTLDAARKKAVTELFRAVGKVAWVEQEELLHGATAISGSGPAYVFAFMEALITAATEQGLAPELAQQLVLQTVLGAAQLASQSERSVSALRSAVTSPGGTTEAALNAMDLNGLIKATVEACATRSKKLAEGWNMVQCNMGLDSLRL